MSKKSKRVLSAIAPGVLVAATGVGAGDLITASLGGSALGLAILWAAVVGAVLKWYLTEGIARWQMATGTTLLEGWSEYLGKWIQWIFLFYLFAWTFFTGGALISACGLAGTGLIQLTNDPVTSKIIWGILHSIVGLFLVLFGGFELFKKIMSICISIMFVTVIVTVVMMEPDLHAVGRGLVLAKIPKEGFGWVLGILGGVGGTVTLLSYGYWIHEEKRSGFSGLRACRVDLAIGYAMTAIFGAAMIIIGSQVEIEGRGARIAPILAAKIQQILGPSGKWIFLLGFWGAVFSSLLGVWQSIPYLFSDFLMISRRQNSKQVESINYTKTSAYRIYLFIIALVPLPILWISAKNAQLIYAVFGSLFIPLLALTLLIMNNRKDWIPQDYRNGILTNIVLFFTLAFFLYVAYTQVVAKLKLLIGI